MDIQKLIKENYEIAKSKGFYPDDSKIEDHLMGIVSEIGEAYEAHRGGKFAKLGEVIQFVGKVDFDVLLRGFDQGLQGAKQYYIDYLSGTFEDEIADIFIRLFNLCGFLGIDNLHINSLCLWDSFNVNDWLIGITKGICSMHLNNDDYYNKILSLVITLIEFCKRLNIPIEKHIQAKMEYNKTREYLHGKQY